MKHHKVTPKPAQPKQPTTMESYFYSYSYTNPPAINGVAAPQSYIGSGFAPVGTYKPGQTIAIRDTATGLKQVGTYTIGNVNDQVKFNATQLNQVSVSEYDRGTTRFIQGTGLSSTPSLKGLGSESGQLIGFGAFGTNVSFNNQHAAIQPIHF
jgi:hypothetical protein